MRVTFALTSLHKAFISTCMLRVQPGHKHRHQTHQHAYARFFNRQMQEQMTEMQKTFARQIEASQKR